jgi:glucosamine-phosphate N-acetyltransferase
MRAWVGMAQIRKCVSADFGQVAALLVQLWPQKVQNLAKLHGAFDRALISTTQRYVCAVEDGEIVGFASLSMKSSLWQEALLANLDELVVDEAWRGRGIGGALIDYVVEIARKTGCSRLELDSAFHRTDAHEFYERRGFEKRAFLFTMAL